MVSKNAEFIEKNGKLIALVFFACYFLLGLFVYQDYGMDYDEVSEREHTTIAFNGAIGHRIPQDQLPDAVNVLPDLFTYSERFYGTFLQMPIALLEYLRGYSIDTSRVFQLRHLWTFLNFFAASFCLFEIIRKRFGKWRHGLLALCFLILMPRLFADSFYNIKDAMFFSWFTISLFFLVKSGEKGRWLYLFCFAGAAAISANLRLIGGILLPLEAVILLSPWLQRKQSAKVCWLRTAVLALSFMGFFILVTPASWKNPLQYLVEALTVFSDYSIAANNIIIYLGKYWSISELPWHYLPVWIAVTTPIASLLLFLLGVFFLIAQLPKRWRQETDFCILDLIFAFIVFVPVLMAIVMHSSLYNGWRHFYFIYSGMIYFMIYALVQLETRKNPAGIRAAAILLLISFINTGCWMVQNHPYQMVYFNQIVRVKAQNLFERDYYALTTKDCLEFILESDPNLTVNVWDHDAGSAVIVWSLPEAERERLHITSVGNSQPADFIVLNYHHIIGNAYSFPFYLPVKHISVDGMRLASVFQRDHSNELAGADIVREISSNVNQSDIQNVIDRDFLSGWSNGTAQNAEDEIIISFDQLYDLYGVTFYQGTWGTEYPYSLEIESSADQGKTWIPVHITDRQGLEFAFENTQCNMLRMHNTRHSDHTWSFAELVFYGSAD